MRAIPDDRGLRTVKELRAPAFTGTLPDWIVDASDGGSTAARDAGHDGGYWRLAPGEDGGEARLETAFDLLPAAYDAIEVCARLRTTDDDVTASVGFERADASLVYGLASDDPALDDRVRAASEDSVESFDARTVDATFEHEVVLRWIRSADAGRPRRDSPGWHRPIPTDSPGWHRPIPTDPTASAVELLLDGTLAATGDVGTLDPERPFRAVWRAGGSDGNGALRVHAVTIRYRERSNPR